MNTESYHQRAVAPIEQTQNLRVGLDDSESVPVATKPMSSTVTFRQGKDERDRAVVGFVQVGGTAEQFDRHVEQFEHYQEIHGRVAGTAIHMAPFQA